MYDSLRQCSEIRDYKNGKKDTVTKHRGEVSKEPFEIYYSEWYKYRISLWDQNVLGYDSHVVLAAANKEVQNVQENIEKNPKGNLPTDRWFIYIYISLFI